MTLPDKGDCWSRQTFIIYKKKLLLKVWGWALKTLIYRWVFLSTYIPYLAIIRILSFAYWIWRSHSRCYREMRIKTVTFSTASKTRIRAKRKGIPSAWKGRDVLNRNSSLGLRESQSQRQSTSSSLIREPRSCPRHFEISSSTSPYSIEKANTESAAKTFTTHFDYCRSHTRVQITFFSLFYFPFRFAFISVL